MKLQTPPHVGESPPPWHVVVTVNPITTLVAEAWLTDQNIDANRVICLSERTFETVHCRIVISKGLETFSGRGKLERIIGVGREAARVSHEVGRITQGQDFILLKANLRDPFEHLLHLSQNCVGVYYLEEGSASHLPWRRQCTHWSSIRVWATWAATLCMLGKRLSDLRLPELFHIEGGRVLGHLALSPSAFPERKSITLVSPPRISETSFDAVFLGDPCVEIGYYDRSERERWLAAVAADLRSRGVKKLGVRVHPSERIFSLVEYKKFFMAASHGSVQVETYPHPVDSVHPQSGCPLYQIASSAAIYGKENGFHIVSMKLATAKVPPHKLRHLNETTQLLDPYVESWL